MDNSEIKRRVDELVSDTACCDRNGCRCWQAVEDLKKVRDYANAEIKKHGPRVSPEVNDAET